MGLSVGRPAEKENAPDFGAIEGLPKSSPGQAKEHFPFHGYALPHRFSRQSNEAEHHGRLIQPRIHKQVADQLCLKPDTRQHSALTLN
jgi:hypothetical protein